MTLIKFDKAAKMFNPLISLGVTVQALAVYIILAVFIAMTGCTTTTVFISPCRMTGRTIGGVCTLVIQGECSCWMSE